MKRNAGIIGQKQSVTIATANGIHDFFDTYNYRLKNLWPRLVEYTGLSVNSGTVYENTSVTATMNTVSLPSNTTLYWTIAHGTTVASDFQSSVTSGSFTQSSSTQTGTFSYGTTFIGNTSKTSKTFQIQIRTGSTAGPVVFTSGTFTIPAIVVSSLYWTPISVNEGSGSNLVFQAANCGSAYSVTLSLANSGTAVAADFFGGTLPTSTTRNPGTLSSQNYTLTADLTTEAAETLTVQISYNGFNIGTAQTLTINDTSTTPTGTISPSTTNVTEGTGVTFTCTMSGSFTGTAYYTINNVSGTMSTSDFSDGLLSGTVTFTSGNGSFVKTLVADGATEAESFSVSLRTTSVSGTVLATTSTITVTDAAAPASTVYTTLGAGSVAVPAGKTSATLEAWGGGGGSFGQDSSVGTGAGGAYAKSVVSVTAGQTIYYFVGSGGTGGQTSASATAGTASWANVGTNLAPTASTTGALAVGGAGGGGTRPNNGTQLASSIGTVIYIGGSGVAGPESGGPGSASSQSNGNSSTAGNGTAGGASGTGGGAGGLGGGSSNSAGDGISNVEGGGGGGGSYNNRGGNGGAPGGAGGQGYSSSLGTVIAGGTNTNTHGYGGDGGRGQVRISFT